MLSVMILLSGSVGVLSAIVGYYIAAWIDTSISGSMALATGLVFVVSFVCSQKHGVVSKLRRSKAGYSVMEEK